MSSEELSFNVSHEYEIPDAAPIPDGQSAQTQTPAGFAAMNSTIAPSGAEQIETSSNASVPMIPYPILFQFFEQQGIQGGADAISASDQFRLTESRLVLEMLTQWNDNIKEQAAEERRRMSQASEIRKQEESLPTSSVLNAIIDAASHPEKAELRGDIVPLLTVGLIFAGTSGVSDAMMIDSASTRMVGVNPAMNQVPEIGLMYASDMRAELGLLGAAMLQGAAYAANAESIFKAGGAAAPEITAKAYADQIIGLVSSNQLTVIVENLVAQEAARTGKPADPALSKQLESQLKVILLSTALAALYTSAKEGGTGKITGEEFLGLLNGTNETFGNNKKLMDDIVALINAQLGGLPKQGADIKGVLAGYFDQNPSLKTLTNPTKVFAQLIPHIRRSDEHGV